MSLSGRMLAAAVVVVALAAAVAMGVALAQQGPARGQGPGPGPLAGPAARPVFFPQAAPVAIWVDKGKVFVASAGKLYRFDAETVQKEMEATYQEPLPPGPPPGGFAPPQPPAGPGR
ncbi:MAG: hypothetical protein H5T86_10760 [Armatimonadetes bacterium]|nr:hypothetical protein [Armatimonadota bacterium]